MKHLNKSRIWENNISTHINMLLSLFGIFLKPKSILISLKYFYNFLKAQKHVDQLIFVEILFTFYY